MEPDWQGSGTDMSTTRRACSSGSSVEGTEMVPSPTGGAGETTTPDPPEEGSGHSHTPRQPPRNGPPTGCVGYLRQGYRDCQISEGATKLLLVSWQQNSSRTYYSQGTKPKTPTKSQRVATTQACAITDDSTIEDIKGIKKNRRNFVKKPSTLKRLTRGKKNLDPEECLQSLTLNNKSEEF